MNELHRIPRGLDLPLAGEPEQALHPAADVTQVALLADDFPGLKPTFHVQPGDRVRRGQLLFEDKTRPGVRHTAPAAGTVAALHRGERRAFRSLVIDVAADDGDAAQQVDFASFTPPAAGRGAAPAADAVRALLLESGLWTALRTRPFSRVPPADAQPYALFITATDTRPHSPSIDVVLDGRHDDLVAGVAALAPLSAGRTFVCVDADNRLPLEALASIAGVEVHRFDGPHPAGNAGTHIHRLAPVDLQRTVWHIAAADVVAVGHLLRTGRLDVGRTVALAGPAVRRPRLLRTRLGASVAQLVHGETIDGGRLRTIAGSVLDGRTAQADVDGGATAFLGRFHHQISVLREATEREFFGWIMPGLRKFSIWNVVAGPATGRPLALDTTTNGGARAMVPIGAFERVMPLDLMPTFLLRALLMRDDERAEALGALELDEEDLALCTFVCPGKAEYGPLLREALNRIAKESA